MSDAESPRADAPQAQILAKKRWRLAAALLDVVPFVPLYIGVAVLPASVTDRDLLFGDDVNRFWLPFLYASDLLICVLGVGYCVVFMLRSGRRRGQTPGKQLCGLAVISADGHAVSAKQTWVRQVLFYVLSPLWIVLLTLDVLWLFFDARQRTLHDVLAGTVVTATTQRARQAPRHVA